MLADILSVAMGISIAFTILSEMVGRMVLLIPDAIRNIREKEKRARRREAYKRFGVEVEGTLMLPQTPEVEALLNGEEPAGDGSK